MNTQLNILTLRGKEIAPFIDGLAKLRMAIFREFPYLYEGSMEYEKKYLKTYLDCPDSLMIVVLDKQQVVGASTAIPLQFETAEVQEPFIKNNISINQVFYFGESLLMHQYRGQNIGKEFFKRREQAAREGNYTIAAFCAVERPSNHPRRPADYIPLDQFWQKLGFQKHPELQTFYSWQDLDETSESLKLMTFWLKYL